MPPSPEDRLNDIHHSIAEIEAFLQGTTFDAFSADRGLRLITERLLEIICEAARHLPSDIKAEAHELDWRKMVDFANRLRHAYQSTDVEVVWDIVQNHIPPLKAFVESRISE